MASLKIKLINCCNKKIGDLLSNQMQIEGEGTLRELKEFTFNFNLETKFKQKVGKSNNMA